MTTVVGGSIVRKMDGGAGRFFIVYLHYLCGLLNLNFGEIKLLYYFVNFT